MREAELLLNGVEIGSLALKWTQIAVMEPADRMSIRRNR
jgi:hypothetical protein